MCLAQDLCFSSTGMSKSSTATEWRRRTRAFLDKQASTLKALKRSKVSEDRPTVATANKVKAVLFARFLTEWQVETFSYIACRSARAEEWHSHFAHWGRRLLKKYPSVVISLVRWSYAQHMRAYVI